MHSVARLLAACFLVVASTDCARGAADSPAASASTVIPSALGQQRYVALGDSFTIGTGTVPSQSFPARLVARWSASGCDVTLTNLAVNGYTTADLIEGELPELAAHHPTWVSLAIGANDVVQGVDAALFRDHIHTIFQAISASGVNPRRVIVLPEPEWPRSPTAASFGAPHALADQVARFDAILHDETDAAGARWVDLRSLMHTEADAQAIASDHLHPSSDAYDAWAAEIAREIPTACEP